MPLRIVLTHPYCGPYVRRGTERNMDVLARYLVQRGYEVVTVSSKPDGTGIEENGNGRRVLLRPLTLPLMSVCRMNTTHTFLLPAYRVLRVIESDVVHSFFFSDAIAASIATDRRKVRTIFQMNGVGVPGVSCHRWLPPEGWLLKRAMTRVDERIACSHYVRDVVKKHYGCDCQVIVPPVDLSQWPLGDGRSSEHPTILCVANFDVRSKGVRVLVKAFNIVRRTMPDAVLRLCGQISSMVQHEILGYLEEEARASVHFLGIGRVKDVPQEYQSAHLLVLPSLGEPSGTVLIEALASGTPVVATNDAGIPEFLDPSISVLFEPKPIGPEATNFEGLAEAMLEGLALSSKPGIRTRCREHARKFSLEVSGPLIERLYVS